MKRGYERAERVADLIQKTLAPMLSERFQNENVKLITITGVNVSSDLSYATVYVSVIMDDDKKVKAVIDELNANVKSLRYELAQAVRLRIAPELKFAYDESIVHGFKMSKLIDEAINQIEHATEPSDSKNDRKKKLPRKPKE